MSGGNDKEAPSALEIQSADQARQMWNQFKETITPLEESAAARVDNPDFNRSNAVTGAVGLQAQDQSIVNQQLGLQERSGAAPGSGRFDATASRGTQALGAGRGRAAIAANEATDSRNIANKLSLVQLGRSQQNLGIATLGQQAQLDVAERSARTEAQAQRRSAITQGIGLGAGIALSQLGNDPVPGNSSLAKGGS